MSTRSFFLPCPASISLLAVRPSSSISLRRRDRFLAIPGARVPPLKEEREPGCNESRHHIATGYLPFDTRTIDVNFFRLGLHVITRCQRLMFRIFSLLFFLSFFFFNEILHARFKAGRRVFFAVSSRNRAHERSVSYHPRASLYHPAILRSITRDQSFLFSSQRTVRFLVMPCDTREINLGMSYAIRINSEVCFLSKARFLSSFSRAFPSHFGK